MNCPGNLQNPFCFQHILHLQRMEVGCHTLLFLFFCTFRSCEYIFQVAPIFPTLHLLRMTCNIYVFYNVVLLFHRNFKFTTYITDIFYKPGHGDSLQGHVSIPSETSVEHSLPPFAALGLLHNLVLCCVDCPQVTGQLDQPVQRLHWPSIWSGLSETTKTSLYKE